MRLHAAIFALSQHIPIVAIDCQVGGRGKVGHLFGDLGAGGNAINIVEIDPNQILRLLTKLTETSAGQLMQKSELL